MKLIVSEGDFVLSEMSEHLTSLIMNTEAFIHQLSKIYKIVLFPFVVSVNVDGTRVHGICK